MIRNQMNTSLIDETPAVRCFDDVQTFKAKLEQVYAPLLEQMQDRSSFVIWVRCPWPEDTPQLFPSGYKLRPNCVLDFAEDLWNESAPRTYQDMKIRAEGPYLDGPDILNQKFPQFTYCRLEEGKPITDIDFKWISANVPSPAALEGLTIGKMQQNWSKLYARTLYNFIDEIKKRRNVTLVVTAFGSGLWSDVVTKTLLLPFFELKYQLPAFNCVVLSDVEQTDDDRSTWIKCTAREFLEYLPYLGMILPRPDYCRVNVDGKLRTLSDEQERTVVQYYDVVAQYLQESRPATPVTCVNGTIVDDEDPEMNYLRGGDWSWRDCSRMLLMNQKFHQEALQSIQRWLDASSRERCYLLKIVHKHGEGGSSAAVRLCLELAKKHPVLALKSGIQLTSELFIKIYRAGQQLSLSLSSPVIIFLRDNSIPNISLQGLATTTVVFISCHSLDWNVERLQSTRPLSGQIYGTEIPLPKSIDNPSDVANFYKRNANAFHERHKTGIRTASPAELDDASPFDFSVCAFLGSDLSAETYVGNCLAKCLLDKEHWLWIAMVQLYTNVNVSLDWFKNREKWPVSMKILQEQRSILVSVDNAKRTVRFCHSYVAKLVFDKLIRELNLESMAKYFSTLPENSLQKLLFERYHSEFSPFIAQLWSHNQFQTLKLALSLTNTLKVEPEIMCHLLILVSRMALRNDKITEDEWKTLDTTTPLQMAEQYAFEAMIKAESIVSNASVSCNSAAVAQMGFVKKMQNNWHGAATFFANSLQLQPTCCGVMQNLIEVNCNIMELEFELPRWIETVKWFYVLSLDDPRCCHNLSNQLALIQKLRPERNVGKTDLQIALLQLQVIVDKPEGFDDTFLHHTGEALLPNLSYSLSIIYPSHFQEAKHLNELVFSDVAKDLLFSRFQTAENLIAVHCLTQQVARWLWSTQGWIAIHNRQYWDVDTSRYDSYKITTDQLMHLTEGATLLIGKLDVSARAVTFKLSNQIGLALIVPIAMYWHVLPEVNCDVLCYIGLAHSSTSKCSERPCCWIVDYIGA